MLIPQPLGDPIDYSPNNEIPKFEAKPCSQTFKKASQSGGTDFPTCGQDHSLPHSPTPHSGRRVLLKEKLSFLYNEL